VYSESQSASEKVVDSLYIARQSLKNDWPVLYQKVCTQLQLQSNTTALETGNTKHLSKVRKQKDEQVKKAEGTVLQFFNTAKVTATQQAHIDLVLFKCFICCSIPFAVLDNPFFRDLLNALTMNYVVPDRSAFFCLSHCPRSSGNQFETLGIPRWPNVLDTLIRWVEYTCKRRDLYVSHHYLEMTINLCSGSCLQRCFCDRISLVRCSTAGIVFHCRILRHIVGTNS